MSKNIIELVKDRNVLFSFYNDGFLWYKTDKGFSFPVPINDCGDASFNKKDKATLFMRYIKNQINNNIREPKINLNIEGKGIQFEYYRKGYCYFNIGEKCLLPISINNNKTVRNIEDNIKFFKDIKNFKESILKD